MITDDELLDDAQTPQAGHNAMGNIAVLVDEHQHISRHIADLEDTLKKKKKQLHELEMNRLPDAMVAVGVETFTTTDGSVVTVKPVVQGSITKDNMPEATKWLRDHDAADIIKREITITFTKGQDDKAQELMTELTDAGYTANNKESVHAQTLGSWAREKLEKGEEIPLKLLGIFHGRKAKIKLPKK